VAELRGDAGSIASTKLRRNGKTPGIVFSGPGGEQQLLAFESKGLGKLVTKLGRTAWACSVFNLQLQSEDGSSETLRVLVSERRGRLAVLCCAGLKLGWAVGCCGVQCLAAVLCCSRQR